MQPLPQPLRPAREGRSRRLPIFSRHLGPGPRLGTLALKQSGSPLVSQAVHLRALA